MKDILKDLTGKKFTRLLILKRVENNKWGQPQWLCRCDCGTELKISGNSLKKSNTKSCGCLNRELARKRRKKINCIIYYENDPTVVGVTLTKNSIAIIDKEDLPIVENYGWHTSHGYAVSRIKNKLIGIHQLILKSPPDKEIDHEDRNKLNNRKSNLRIVSHSDNTKNTSKYKNNSSGCTGVSFNKKAKKYISYLNFNGKRIFLGYFSNPIDASNERDKLAQKLSNYYALHSDKSNKSN